MSELKEGYKDTEVGIIPEDWNVISIGEVAQIVSGGTPSSYISKYWNGNILWCTPTDITKNNSKYLYDTEKKITELGLKNSSATMLPPASILLCTRATIGEAAITKNEIATNQGFKSLICHKKYNNEYIYYYLPRLKNKMLEKSFGSTFLEISKRNLSTIKIALPSSFEEQQAIAEALSDIDTLISTLNKQIEKKKNIKQGAMQDLLSGKRRLEGFSGEWKNVRLRELAKSINTGKKNNEDQVNEGVFPFFVRSQTVCSIDSFSYDGEAILIPGEGGIGTIIHYIKGKFDYHQRVYKISDFINSDCKFIYYNMMTFFQEHANKNSVKATVDSLRLSSFLEYELYIPPTKQEQTAIAQILTDMDNEIEQLEKKRDKYLNIKSGMMQQLLTGQIRLTVSAETSQQTQKVHPIAGTKKQKFEDAVLIAAIVNAFYSDKYPLGRKKVQKLLYLLRRKQEANTMQFKRKAAGPYADEVRYKGGEPIAKNKKYIVSTSGKLGTVFGKGECIGEALSYIQKWGMQADIDWLVSKFLFTPVNQLEVLATIDMAIVDLRKEEKPISLISIKELIKSDKEWKEKLNKPYFSDINIQNAINENVILF